MAHSSDGRILSNTSTEQNDIRAFLFGTLEIASSIYDSYSIKEIEKEQASLMKQITTADCETSQAAEQLNEIKQKWMDLEHSKIKRRVYISREEVENNLNKAIENRRKRIELYHRLEFQCSQNYQPR